MSDASGTIEKIVVELGSAIEPLEDILGPQLFDALGVTLPHSLATQPAIVNKFTAAATTAKKLRPQVTELSNAISGGDSNQILAASVKSIGTLVELIVRLVEAGDAIDGAASDNEVKKLAEDMAVRILEYVTVGYLDKKLPNLTTVFNVLGVLDKEHVPAPGMDVSSVPTEAIPRRFYLDRIPKLFMDPEGFLDEIYGWKGNAAQFKGDVLLLKILAMLESFGIPGVIYQAPGQPTILEAYFFNIEIRETGGKPEIVLNFSLPGNASFERTIPFSDVWSGTTKVEASFAAGISASIRPPFDVQVSPPSGNVDLTASLGILAQKSGGDPIDIISFTGGSRLQVQKISASLGARASFGTSGGSVLPTFQVDFSGGKLIIDFSQGDGFIQKILSGLNVEAEFSLGADWDPERGFRFRGDAGIEILLPLHLDLSVIVIDGLYFSIGISEDIPVQLGLATQFSANLGPLKAVVERIGVNINLTFPSNGQGNLGMADLGFGFRPPNGVGLSLDVGVVRGGGYLYFDFDKEEYAGVLELSIAEIVTVKAIALITTRMPDGSKGFSLLIIITAEFGTGIQLGFGFTLIGVGGLLGLNRTMLPEAIAAGIRSGGINSIMFPPDPIQNAPKIISDLRTYFPPYEGKFLIGPMVKIGWGTPTLVSLSFGLIIEVPGNIAIIGILKIALPTEEAAIVVLNVAFIGALEFDKQRLWFYASIYDSRILFLTLEGDMGLLMDYGDNSNFVLSVGGFHPMFNPPPMPFPDLRRLRIDVLNTSFARISVEAYFAVTSNTVQFGARAELYVGLAVVEVTGHFAFDALFQFSPFKFIISMSFSVSLKVFGIGLFSIHLELSLEGPTPWNARGTGRLTIDLWLFEISISASFDVTWGDAQNTMLPPVAVIPLLVAEFDKTDNWKANLPAGNNLLVSLRNPESEGLVLHPIGTLKISQRAVPLNLKIDKVGNRSADDANTFVVKVTSPDLAETGNRPKEKFAIAQYQDLSNDEKLKRPAFQEFEGGVELSVAGRQLGSSKATRRIVRYETIIIDSNFKRFVRKYFVQIGMLFNHFLNGGAVSKSKLSNAYKKSIVPFDLDDRVKVDEPAYVVAGVTDNKAVSGSKAFANEALAREFMQSMISDNPNQNGEVHVIPVFEASLN